MLEEDYSQCVALIFLIDRYTFWTGTCKAALAVLKFIEERSPQTPVPPQVVIRKARVLKNDGDIQGAYSCSVGRAQFDFFQSWVLFSWCQMLYIFINRERQWNCRKNRKFIHVGRSGRSTLH